MSFLPVIILSWLTDRITGAIGRGIERREREYYKKRTYDPELGIYRDQYATYRSIKDDSYVSVRRNVYGETEVKYANGVIRNLKQEENNKKPGSVTELTGYSNNDHAVYMREAIGHRYKDRKNGKIYVMRFLEYPNKQFFNFFVDINDGSIVRPTDGQLELERRAKELKKQYYSDEDFKVIIKYFDDRRVSRYPEQLFRNKYDSCELSEEYIVDALRYRKEI